MKYDLFIASALFHMMKILSYEKILVNGLYGKWALP